MRDVKILRRWRYSSPRCNNLNNCGEVSKIGRNGKDTENTNQTHTPLATWCFFSGSTSCACVNLISVWYVGMDRSEAHRWNLVAFKMARFQSAQSVTYREWSILCLFILWVTVRRGVLFVWIPCVCVRVWFCVVEGFFYPPGRLIVIEWIMTVGTLLLFFLTHSEIVRAGGKRLFHYMCVNRLVRLVSELSSV